MGPSVQSSMTMVGGCIMANPKIGEGLLCVPAERWEQCGVCVHAPVQPHALLPACPVSYLSVFHCWRVRPHTYTHTATLRRREGDCVRGEPFLQ